MDFVEDEGNDTKLRQAMHVVASYVSGAAFTHGEEAQENMNEYLASLGIDPEEEAYMGDPKAKPDEKLLHQIRRTEAMGYQKDKRDG